MIPGRERRTLSPENSPFALAALLRERLPNFKQEKSQVCILVQRSGKTPCPIVVARSFFCYV